MSTQSPRIRCPECGRSELDIYQDDDDDDDETAWVIQCLICGWVDLANNAEVEQP